MEELVLEISRTRGDDDLSARQHGWYQIGKGFTGSGPRFGNQRTPRIDAAGNRLRHLLLLRTVPETLDALRK